MRRLMIVMSEQERDALLAMAEKNLRGAREELRHLLREEAGRCGLLRIEAETHSVPTKMEGGESYAAAK